MVLGEKQLAGRDLGVALEDDLADSELGAFVDADLDVHLVLPLADDLGVDLRGQQALFGEQVGDGVLDALDLVGAVIGIGQDGLVLLLQLVDDVLFLDLLPRLVGHGPDDGILFDRDLEDHPPGSPRT